MGQKYGPPEPLAGWLEPAGCFPRPARRPIMAP
jgi:hypothetical protein